MNFKNLLDSAKIAPSSVLVLRHRPLEPELNKVLPWLACERPKVFNAYQQSQTKQVETEMSRASHVAAFIGQVPSTAIYVGLYKVEGSKAISAKQYAKIPENNELTTFGHHGFTETSDRKSILWFDLALTDFHKEWKGRLIVRWPPLDKNWHRWAHKPNNEMPVDAILPKTALDAAMPNWDEIEISWDTLRVLPTSWKQRMNEWRAIYYIFDTSRNKGYVGSAYGTNNLMQRWENYATTGHGGNQLLKQCNPENFLFTILQRPSPDMRIDDVVELENSWKRRLHSIHPFGLNLK